MIDLHMHTRYSDGTDTVEELLQKAEQLQLETISITDHNTCKAYNDLENPSIRKQYTGEIIPGIELNTKVLGIPIEILGYSIQVKKMQKLVEQTYKSNEQRNRLEVERLQERCKKANIALPENFVTEYIPNIYPSKYLHEWIVQDKKNKSLIDEESWNSSDVFYRKYMSNPDTIFYIDMDDILPTFQQAANLIREASGKVFLPHIYEYRENSQKILDFILENEEIDGIECYYTTFSKQQTEYLLELCTKRKLKVSGGSDYHGLRKKEVFMGNGKGDLKIPKSILKNWF